MKTTFKMMAAGVLLAAAAAVAQRPFGVMTSSTPPDPATMVANQVTRLTTLLSLTSSQAGQATTIFTNAATAITPLQTSLNADWTSMQAAVQSDSTTTIDSLSASIGILTGQITDTQNKADAAFYAILTSAQQTTLNSSGGMGGPGHGPGPGGPGGPGGRP
jgi:Spy/CpxP family protein refolding chaperone